LTKPVPDSWRRALKRHVALYRYFTEEERARLHGHVQVLLAEKDFEGCGGLRLTDDMRVAVAGQAAVLLLGRDMDYFPALRTVLIYPSGYRAKVREHPFPGLVQEEISERWGESWERGTVVLAWDRSRDGGAGATDGFNLVIHEFAHQIDAQYGLTEARAPGDWRKIFSAAFQSLRRAVERGEEPLDPYGADSPAEFFAVATEYFFEAPWALRDFHPAFFKKMIWLYNQDPSRFWRHGRPA